MAFSSMFLAVAANLLVSTVNGASSCQPTNGSSTALTCATFLQSYPELTFFPNDTSYTALNEDFFSAAEWLGPACIFAPTSAEIMSFAVKTLVQSGVQFAIRGGGHMPIAGSANINSSGILLSSSGLSSLQVSDDLFTVSVGPGRRWGAVYRYLEPYGRTVVGGRLGVVGVPGLLLGGGISFFGNEYGWASANIASFECVLSDGSIVNAEANNEYSDLYWALRGGGNSFAIVTSFELKTIDAAAVVVGQASYGTGLRDQFLDSVFGFAFNGVLDKKAAVIPTVTWSPSIGTDPTYSSMLFYNGNDTSPPALANFTGTDAPLSPTTSSFTYRTMANWANESETGFEAVHGMHFRFHVVSFVANREAMGFIHDTFLNIANNSLSNVTGILVTLAMMPISESFITANRGDGLTGDPMGIDATKAPYIWVEESIMWASAEDEPLIDSFIHQANAAIDAKLAELDVTSPYLYLNDADRDQPVFEGYAPENVARLKEIREKYDPRGIYTNQMSGGFKVAAA